ncbi:hypothetical protein V8G54_008787 [Vigna mungo]|uniref:Uncharacterized protein n=1 Tax=Vigna mungo TaxID=3915 RepID=A0AAQ3P4H3_VIGMU
MKIESDKLKKVNSDKMFQHTEDTAVLKLGDQLQHQLDWKKKKKHLLQRQKIVKMKNNEWVKLTLLSNSKMAVIQETEYLHTYFHRQHLHFRKLGNKFIQITLTSFVSLDSVCAIIILTKHSFLLFFVSCF